MPTAVNELQIKYKSDISELQAKVTQLETSMKKVDTAAKNTGETIEKGFKKGADAVKDVEAKTNPLAEGFNKLGAAVIAGFAVERLIAFGTAAVNAFAEAEKAQIKLLFALGGQKDVQQRLIAQAQDLQDTLGIDNDVIVKQQAFLAGQKLTEEQIKKTIIAATNLSAAIPELDFESAVKQLAQTFEGTEGRLGQLDSRFSELTKTQLKNGEAINLANEKYKGFAEAGAQSVSGQLEIQQRKFDDLTKQIGEKLAPAFVGLKVATAEFFASAIRGFEQFATSGQAGHDRAIANAKTQIEKEVEKQFAEKRTFEVRRALADANNKLIVSEQEAQKKANELKNAGFKLGSGLSDAKKFADQEVELNKAKVAALKSLLDKRLTDETNAAKQAVTTLQDLKDQLQKLETDQGSVAETDVAGREKFIKDIADTKRRIAIINGQAAEDQRKLAEDAAKALEDIEKKNLASSLKTLAESEEDRLNVLRKAALDELEIKSKAAGVSNTSTRFLEDQKVINDDFNKQISDAKIKSAEEAEKKIQEIIKKFDDENLAIDLASIDQNTSEQQNAVLERYNQIGTLSKDQEQQLADELKNIALANEIIKQDVIIGTVEFGSAAYIKAVDARQKAVNGILEQGLTEEVVIEKRKQQLKEDAAKVEIEIEKNKQELIRQIRDQALSGARDFINAEFEAIIQSQKEAGDAKIKSIDDQIKANQDLRDRDIISQREFNETNKQLLNEKTAAEKKQREELAKIKTQQAIAEKLFGILQVGVTTAQAVAKVTAEVAAITAASVLNPFLIPLIAVAASQIPFVIASGALQAGIIAARPIPQFAKGTKDAHNHSGLSMVGEQGAELMFVPQHAKILPAGKTKQYAAMIDAMYDNRLNEYLQKMYISPALKQQQMAYEIYKQESFATNVANSFMIQSNGLTASEMDFIRRKGTTIKNADELAALIAKEVAKAIPQQGYRRYS